MECFGERFRRGLCVLLSFSFLEAAERNTTNLTNVQLNAAALKSTAEVGQAGHHPSGEGYMI
jgi:hypothetical protein